MANAACTGSSTSAVPGTLTPWGTMVPGATGPISSVQSGWRSASQAQASESARASRAVS